MANLNSHFFALLRFSLGIDRNFTLRPTAGEWMQLYEQACKQRLVGVMYEGVSQLPEDCFEPVSSNGADPEAYMPQQLATQWAYDAEMIAGLNDLQNRKAAELTTLNSLGLGEDAEDNTTHHFRIPPDEDGIEVEVHYMPGSGNLNTTTNERLQLSESAGWLWREAQRQGDFTVESLAEALYQEYDITPENALADVAELTVQWQQAGVVE